MRSIAGTTLFTIIAVVTLLMSTTFMGQAQAFGLNISRCPCNFLPALLFAKKEVAKFGHPLAIQECTKSEEGIRATGTNAFCSVIELEAERSSETGETRECGYEFACPAIEDGDAPLFILKSEKDNLTHAEFQACVRDIEHISKFLFLVDCNSDD